MKQPTVHQAHGICDSVKARGVIVLAFSKDKVAGASYGETKAECKQIGYTLDQIIEDLRGGRLPVWATKESEAARLKVRDAEIIRRGIEDGYYCPKCKLPTFDCDCEDIDTGLCQGCGKHPDDCDCHEEEK